MLKIIHEDESSPLSGTPAAATPPAASEATEPQNLSGLSLDPSPSTPRAEAEPDEVVQETEPSLDLAVPSGQDATSPRRGPPPKRTWSPPPVLKPSRHPSELPPHPLFAVKQLGIDRRLLVNRKKQLKMYRVWLQSEFTKVAANQGTGQTAQSGENLATVENS